MSETLVLAGHADPDMPTLLTHPIAEVETDDTPGNTTVVLVLKDGTRIDVTTCCSRVAKSPDSPIVEVTLLTVAPRVDIDGRREILVAA